MMLFVLACSCNGRGCTNYDAVVSSPDGTVLGEGEGTTEREALTEACERACDDTPAAESCTAACTSDSPDCAPTCEERAEAVCEQTCRAGEGVVIEYDADPIEGAAGWLFGELLESLFRGLLRGCLSGG